MATLLTPQETAGRLRCSLAQVYAFSSRGVLPKVKIGRKLLFKEADVELYIEQCSVAPREPLDEV